MDRDTQELAKVLLSRGQVEVKNRTKWKKKNPHLRLHEREKLTEKWDIIKNRIRSCCSKKKY